MIKDDLTALGLSPEEAKVYLATLELGGGHVSIIAKKAKVHRVTCYNTLGNLVKKGLIVFSQHKKIRFYSPEPPQVLLHQMEEKYSMTQRILPGLMALQRSSAFTPKIRYYEEKENIMAIFGDMASAKSEILGYTNLVPLRDLFPEVLEKIRENFFSKKAQRKVFVPF